jgi:hypothetical protein
MADTRGSGRYFVTVIAPSREALLALRQYDIDLFKPTAREVAPAEPGALGAPATAAGAPGAGGEFAIDGLLTLDEIGYLVSAGYRVLVQEDAARKARGQLSPRPETRAAGREAAPDGAAAIGFEEWLSGMQEPAPPPAPPRRRRRQGPAAPPAPGQ